jgi:hypothetical protein
MKLRGEDFVKEFSKAELPPLDEITTIDENFRQRLFVEWVNDSPSGQFKQMKEKVGQLIPKREFVKWEALNPAENATRDRIADLITVMDFNKTHKVNLAVPDNLRLVLFDKWEDHGMDLVKLLFQYSEEL